MAWYALGDFGRAEPLLRQAAETVSRVADAHDLLYVAALNNLGVLYTATGDRDQAEGVFKQALDAVRLPEGRPNRWAS
jgi:tetratricopeptide (TPR) repeat protein